MGQYGKIDAGLFWREEQSAMEPRLIYGSEDPQSLQAMAQLEKYARRTTPTVEEELWKV